MDDIVKIIVADDNKLFVEGLLTFLSLHKKYEVIGTFINGKELMDSPLIHEADLILTDIKMPILDGIKATKQINFINPEGERK